MRKILEELWRGNVYPSGDCRPVTKEARELMGCVAEHYDSLYATLTGKQKEELEKYEDCYSELASINEKEIFVHAFSLGAKIAIEVMGLGQD